MSILHEGTTGSEYTGVVDTENLSVPTRAKVICQCYDRVVGKQDIPPPYFHLPTTQHHHGGGRHHHALKCGGEPTSDIQGRSRCNGTAVGCQKQ